MSIAGLKNPIFLNYDEATFTKETLTMLQREGYREVVAFVGGFKNRFIQSVQMLKIMNDNSNIGEKFGLDEKLHAEIKRLLSSICYLTNSTSFRDGKYHEFDKMEIDMKLGRRQ